MISHGRYGYYGGKPYYFTHRNPKNGDVWSDEIPVREYNERGKVVIRYGTWVASDKVKWL